jgi:hypothetical protein
MGSGIINSVVHLLSFKRFTAYRVKNNFGTTYANK